MKLMLALNLNQGLRERETEKNFKNHEKLAEIGTHESSGCKHSSGADVQWSKLGKRLLYGIQFQIWAANNPYHDAQSRDWTK